jgi:hypothetical protein
MGKPRENEPVGRGLVRKTGSRRILHAETQRWPDLKGPTGSKSAFAGNSGDKEKRARLGVGHRAPCIAPALILRNRHHGFPEIARAGSNRPATQEQTRIAGIAKMLELVDRLDQCRKLPICQIWPETTIFGMNGTRIYGADPV